MEKAQALFSYCLTKNGISLTMQKGCLEDEYGNLINRVSAQRLRFYGNRIPMPVRSGTWFQGLTVREMLSWLYDNGWTLHSRADLCSGIIYPCIKGNETSDDGNDASADEEEAARQEEVARVRGERALRETVVFLYGNNMRVTALKLYSYVKKCSLNEANNAIREMVALDEESGIC